MPSTIQNIFILGGLGAAGGALVSGNIMVGAGFGLACATLLPMMANLLEG
jgi:hypothetical protein